MHITNSSSIPIPSTTATVSFFHEEQKLEQPSYRPNGDQQQNIPHHVLNVQEQNRNSISVTDSPISTQQQTPPIHTSSYQPYLAYGMPPLASQQFGGIQQYQAIT